MSRARYLKDFVDEFTELGPTRFQSANPLPALAWVGLVGRLDEGAGPRRRPTSRMDAQALERDLEVARLVNQVWIVCRDGRSKGSEITAGRAGDNDLIIPEYSVSQRHCHFRVQINRLLRSRPRRLFVTDLESLNGTAVRGQRVEPSEETELWAGDDLAIGRLRFVVLDAAGFVRKVAEAAGVRLD